MRICELSIKLNIDKDLENKINTVVLTNKEQNLESYILKLIDRDKLFHDDKEIELTKTEYKIFMILINNKR